MADAHRQLLEATTTGDRSALMQPPLVLMMPQPTDDLDNVVESKRSVGGDFVPKKGMNVEEIVDYGDQQQMEPVPYAKKATGLSPSNGYMMLNKFNGSGSRNCFFTPIQVFFLIRDSNWKWILGLGAFIKKGEMD